eukprot:TRINITY_DN401_c0_g3_i1.p1 TRINITY_DN401_c0_g3~~TRINITY_DN401_c0_g3_i1.p1  ORF type:complete len:430 (+),score=72.12 TRINITY_DN401_c0_g3_i1:117-1292(+)
MAYAASLEEPFWATGGSPSPSPATAPPRAPLPTTVSPAAVWPGSWTHGDPSLSHWYPSGHSDSAKQPLPWGHAVVAGPLPAFPPYAPSSAPTPYPVVTAPYPLWGAPPPPQPEGRSDLWSLPRHAVPPPHLNIFAPHYLPSQTNHRDAFRPYEARSPSSPSVSSGGISGSGNSSSGESDTPLDAAAQAADLDAQLVARILEYFGQTSGSLPSERVQNVIKKEHRELYDAVFVSARFGKKWHRFLAHHADTFQLFTIPSNPTADQDYCWRIRLTGNEDWEAADLAEEKRRAVQEGFLLARMHDLLAARPGHSAPMAEIIHELNHEAPAPAQANRDDDAEGDVPRRIRKVRVNDLKRILRQPGSGLSVHDLSPEGEPSRTVTYLVLDTPPDRL